VHEVEVKVKTNLYIAIKSEDSEALDGGNSRLSSQTAISPWIHWCGPTAASADTLDEK